MIKQSKNLTLGEKNIKYKSDYLKVFNHLFQVRRNFF